MDYYYDFMRMSEDFTAAMPISSNVEEKAQRKKLLMLSCYEAWRRSMMWFDLSCCRVKIWVLCLMP